MIAELKNSNALPLLLLAALGLSYPALAANGNGNAIQIQGTASPGNQKFPASSGPRAAPGGVSGSGQSYGSGAINNERAGYIGGRVMSAEPIENSTAGTPTSTTVVVGTSNSTENCRNFVPVRMEGLNLARFRQAEELLEHGKQLPQNRDMNYLLANYQEELAKPSPDLSLAGTYVGLVATEPVTASDIENISNILCVPVSHEQAVDISTAAESQRLFVGRDR